MQSPVVIKCPHCEQLLEVLAINCGIFRHGVDKVTGRQIPPHLLKPQCDALVASDAIYGCGKPFRYLGPKRGAVKCPYI